jgi:hypothetical protein
LKRYENHPAITANVNITQIKIKFLEKISGKGFTFSVETSVVFLVQALIENSQKW